MVAEAGDGLSAPVDLQVEDIGPAIVAGGVEVLPFFADSGGIDLGDYQALIA